MIAFVAMFLWIFEACFGESGQSKRAVIQCPRYGLCNRAYVEKWSWKKLDAVSMNAKNMFSCDFTKCFMKVYIQTRRRLLDCIDVWIWTTRWGKGGIEVVQGGQNKKKHWPWFGSMLHVYWDSFAGGVFWRLDYSSFFLKRKMHLSILLENYTRKKHNETFQLASYLTLPTKIDYGHM